MASSFVYKPPSPAGCAPFTFFKAFFIAYQAKIRKKRRSQCSSVQFKEYLKTYFYIHSYFDYNEINFIDS